jgi:hypothetical protein
VTDLPNFEAVARDTPVAFFPVRVETRFGFRDAVAGGTPVQVPVLRVRIYPDELQVDDHERDLTASEIAAGRTFWDEHGNASQDPSPAREERRMAAWTGLIGAVGPRRVAYTARITRDPAAALAARSRPRLAAQARLLPDAWVVTGWLRGQRVVTGVTLPVRSPLAVGPTPIAGATTDSRGLLMPDFDAPPSGQRPLDPENPLLLDGDSVWLADYDAAVAAGMAVTLDLASPDEALSNAQTPQQTEGLDRLFVLGVRVPTAERTVEAETLEVADLLAAHVARNGAGFLAPGTPTNNLADKPSGWSSAFDAAALYHAVVEGAPIGPGGDALVGDAPVATIAATALGLPVDVFAGFDRAGADDLRYARLMNEAMFPITWGELIGQLLVPAEFDATRDGPIADLLARAFDFADDHVRDHVRAGGPLPVLRIGAQPYGLLPVTDPSRWRAQPGEPDGTTVAELVDLLGRLRSFWSVAADQTPKLDQAGAADVGGNLADILGLGPVPHEGSYWLEPITGELTSKVFSSIRPQFEMTDGQGNLSQRSIGMLANDSMLSVIRGLIATVPRGNVVHRSRLQRIKRGDAAHLRIPVARTTDTTSPAAYLKHLGQARFGIVGIMLDLAVEEPVDLLYQLGRRSLSVANEQAGFVALQALDDHIGLRRVLEAKQLSAEAISLKASTGPSILSLMAEPARVFVSEPAVATLGAFADRPIAELIADREAIHLLPIALPPTSALHIATREALHALGAANLPDATYVRLLGETLAAASTRLDAWVTSVATRRLRQQRAARPAGIQVGGYGWLTDVRPTPVNPPMPASSTLPGWDVEELGEKNLISPQHPVGFVHAPSLAQAKSAAILRAGELAHGDEQSSIAHIDLTSARVRTGEWILAAVRNGQPLGAVLGYRLERLLHERSRIDVQPIVNLHRIVDDLRARFPQRGERPAPGPDEEVAPREVVDGMALRLAWQGDVTSGTARVLGGLGLNPEETTVFEGIMKLLDGAVESVADLIVAEGVHQLAAGDHPKAGATFAAVASGGVPPADIDVLRTPRSGVSVTDRVVLPLVAAGGVAGWNRELPRAIVAPELERWAEDRLGAPADWTVTLIGKDDARAQVTLADAGPLCALDVLAELPIDGGEHSPLVERLAATTALVDARADVAADGGPRSWAGLTAYGSVLADLIGAARPLTRTDLADPAPDVDPRGTRIPPPKPITEAAFQELHDRLFRAADGVLTRLRATQKDLATLLPPPDQPAAAGAAIDLAGVKGQLLKLRDYGLAGDGLRVNLDAERVVAAAYAGAAAAARLLDDAEARRDRLKEIGPGGDHPQSMEARLDALRTLVQAVFGRVVVVSPSLRDDGSPAGIDLAAARPVQPEASHVDRWVHALSSVRPNLTILADARLFGGALERPPLRFEVAQRPLVEADGWLGDAFQPVAVTRNAPPRWRTPDGPRTHLLVLTGPAGVTAPVEHGLVLDEFVEVIPSSVQTTGVAVHYDAPGARPPQSILIGIHPDPAGTAWSWEMVEAMLADTLDLARLRTVELDDLAVTSIDEFLPATYVREGIDDLDPLVSTIQIWLALGAEWTDAMIAANRTTRANP